MTEAGSNDEGEKLGTMTQKISTAFCEWHGSKPWLLEVQGSSTRSK